MDSDKTKSESLNKGLEESGLLEEMNVTTTEPANSESVEAVNMESANPASMELAESVSMEPLDQVDAEIPSAIEMVDPAAMETLKKQSTESSQPANAEPLKSGQNDQGVEIIMLDKKKANVKKKVVIRKKKVVKPKVAKASAMVTKSKGKVMVKKKVSKQDVPVVLIDLTDEAPKESVQTIVEGKDHDEKQSQHQVLVQPLNNLSDLKDEKLISLLKNTGSVKVTFLGHRYEEKKGFMQLQLNKTIYDEVITTSKVELSNGRSLSTEHMPEIGHCVENPVLQKMTGEGTVGEDLELTSVFVNNIPSDTRPGIMKMLFPAAKNIQFPTLKDGKSQG